MYKVFNAMNLKWKEDVIPLEVPVNGLRERRVFLAESDQIKEKLISVNIEECIDKSVALLGENITESSLYYLCEWNTMCSTLTIVVTDETKRMDSKNIVKCCFNTLNKTCHQLNAESAVERESIVNDYADRVCEYIRDYLTTCSGFMNYSLVAVFHSSDRDSVELL